MPHHPPWQLSEQSTPTSWQPYSGLRCLSSPPSPPHSLILSNPQCHREDGVLSCTQFNSIITVNPAITVRPTSQWAVLSCLCSSGGISALRAFFKQGGSQVPPPVRNKVLTVPKAVYVITGACWRGRGCGVVLEAATFCIKEELPSSRRSGRAGSGIGGWPPWSLVWLLIQKAGEHGEGSLGHVGGDHVSSALDGEKGDMGEFLHEAGNLLPTVPVVH